MDGLVENMNALNVNVKPHIEEHPVFKLLPPDMVNKVLAERFKKDVESMRKGAENIKLQQLQDIDDEADELDDNLYREYKNHFIQEKRVVVNIYERKAALYNKMLQPLKQMGY